MKAFRRALPTSRPCSKRRILLLIPFQVVTESTHHPCSINCTTTYTATFEIFIDVEKRFWMFFLNSTRVMRRMRVKKNWPLNWVEPKRKIAILSCLNITVITSLTGMVIGIKYDDCMFVISIVSNVRFAERNNSLLHIPQDMLIVLTPIQKIYIASSLDDRLKNCSRISQQS